MQADAVKGRSMLEESAHEAGYSGQQQLKHNLESLNAMVAYAADVGTCRRVLLLRHFGETFDRRRCRNARGEGEIDKQLPCVARTDSLTKVECRQRRSLMPNAFVSSSAAAHMVACAGRARAAHAGTCDACKHDGGELQAEDCSALAQSVVQAVHDLNTRDLVADLAAAIALIKVRSISAQRLLYQLLSSCASSSTQERRRGHSEFTRFPLPQEDEARAGQRRDKEFKKADPLNRVWGVRRPFLSTLPCHVCAAQRRSTHYCCSPVCTSACCMQRTSTWHRHAARLRRAALARADAQGSRGEQAQLQRLADKPRGRHPLGHRG